MTGQLRREYSGWPSLKSVTLIMFSAKMSAQQTVWDHWGKGVHPTVMYLQINSNVSSKKKRSSIQEQGWRFGARGDGLYIRELPMPLSPSQPQLLNTNRSSLDGSFAQKWESEIWPTSGRTSPVETPPTSRHMHRFAKTNRAECRVSGTALLQHALSHEGPPAHVQQLPAKGE